MGVLIEHEETRERKILTDSEFTDFMLDQQEMGGIWHVVETTTINPDSAMLRAQMEESHRKEKRLWEMQERSLRDAIDRADDFLMEILEAVLSCHRDNIILLGTNMTAKGILEAGIKIAKRTKGTLENGIVAACDVFGVKWDPLGHFGGDDPEDDFDYE